MQEHVERSSLALALGDNPVLDADVLAAVWIGQRAMSPARKFRERSFRDSRPRPLRGRA
jgi:hypothetical protein